MIQEKLNKQVKIAIWQLVAGIGIIVGAVIMGLTAATIVNSGYTTSNSAGVSVGWIIGLAIIIITCVLQLVLWIVGIINAAQINTMTGDGAILVVFSIFTFWIVHLIIAVTMRNRYATQRPQPRQTTHNNTSNYETKLKESFMHGIITAAEYEKKLKDHQNGTKK